MDTKLFMSRRAAMNSILQKTKLNKEILSGKSYTSVETGIEKVSEESANRISVFNPNIKQVFQDLNQALIISGGINSDKTKIKKSNDIIGKTVYGRLFKENFFQELNTLTQNTKKHQSGSSLFSNAIKIDRVNYNKTSKPDMIDFQELYSAVNKANDILSGTSGNIITYDLETLGGINSFGHQQYDFITELSATVWNEKKEKVESINSILGLTDEEYNKTIDYLNSLKYKKHQDYSSLDRVYIDRLSMYGHKNLKTSINGFEHRIVESADPIEIENTVDNAIKGAKYLREVQERQTEYLIANNINESYSSYRQKYIQRYADLVYKGQGVNNYNNFVALGQNNSMFDDTMVSVALGKNIEHLPGTNFDLYQLNKYTNEYLGNNKFIPENMRATNMFGLATQDQLKYLYFKHSSNFDPTKVSAHNAMEDENTLFRILSDDTFIPGSNYAEFVLNNANQVREKMTNLYGTSDQSINNLYYVNKTQSTAINTNKHGLGFTYNPIDKSFKTYDGFRIIDGEVSKDSFNGFGPRANTLYKQTAFEINLNENWKNTFSNIGLSEEIIERYYDEYANTDKLYVLRSEEYINKSKIRDKFGKDAIQEMSPIHYSIFRSKEELSANLGTRIGKVGANNAIYFDKDAVKALDFKQLISGNSHILINDLSDDKIKDMLIDRSMNRTKTDSSARTIRDMSYDKFSKFKKYNEVNHMSISKRISELVANNQSLDTSIAQELIEELGFFDYTTKNMKILPETIQKANIIDEYVSTLSPFFNALESVFKEKGIPDTFKIEGKAIKNIDNKSIRTKKDIIFKTMLTNYLESRTAKNPINNSTIFTSDELNKIDFDANLFPDFNRTMGTSLFNESTNYKTLDLNKDDAFVKFFYNNFYGKSDLNMKNSNAGFDAIVKGVDLIKKDSRFKGVFKDIDVMDYQSDNLSQLSAELTNRLKSYVIKKREKNPGFGLKFNREVQDPTNLTNLKHLIEDEDSIKAFINSNYDSMIKDVYVADNKNKVLIDDIVNKYFMPFSQNDFYKSLNKYNKQQQEIFKMQYSLAKESSYKMAEDLVNAINGKNLELIINGTGKNTSMFIKHNNEVKKLNMFKFTNTNGIINYNINNNNYAMDFMYDVNEIVKFGKKNNFNDSLFNHIKFNSNIGTVLDRMRGFKDTVDRAIESDDDLLDAISYVDSKIAKVLREVGPRRDAFNFNNLIDRNMRVDWNGLIKILPELDSEGLIKQANQMYNIPENYTKQMQQLINKVKFQRPESIKDLLASEQNLLNQIYLNPITTLVNERLSYEKIDGRSVKLITDYMSTFIQDTKVDLGKLSINSTPFSTGTAKFDDLMRSVANQQGNGILYDKKQIVEELQEMKRTSNSSVNSLLNSVTPGGKLFTKASENLVNNINGYTTGATLKYLEIDSDSLRKIFKNSEVKFSDYISRNFKDINSYELGELFKEKALKLNTYEQESNINARINYLFFNKNNDKLIDAKNNLMITHSNNLSVINSIKKSEKLMPLIDENGHIKYQLGYEVKNGQLLGLFGETETKKYARNAGVFRGRYFDDFGEVSEERLNAEIQKALKANKIKNNRFEINAYLDSIYDFKYQVYDKFETYGHKLYNGASEKSTANVMDVAMGTLDKSLIRELEEQGFIGLNNKVLSKKYIEEFLLPQVNNPKAIKERILKERFAFSDALTTMFDEFKDISQIMNVNIKKHQSISIALDNIVNQLEQLPDKTDYYDVLFGKGKYQLKNNSLIFDNVDKVNLSDFSALSESQRNTLNLILNSNEYLTTDGYRRTLVNPKDAIGHTGYSYVIHAKDDPAGTYSSNANMYNIRRQIDDIDFYISRAVKNNIDEATTKDRIKELTERKIELVQKLDQIESEKGLLFDKRMNLILKRQTYDNDSIKLAKERLSDKEFKEVFGHALDNSGNIREDFLGKSILEPVTRELNNQVLLSKNDIKLSDVSKDDYKYLHSAFSNIADSIGLTKANDLYSYLQGKRAIEFNSNPTSSMIDKLTSMSEEHKFNLVDLSNLNRNDDGWLDLDIGGQGKTITTAKNNPYTQNMIIKTGLGGKHEYLAISRMPEKHYEDTLIKYDHISKLGQLQRTLKDINSGDISDLDSTKDYARNLIDQIKTSQIKDITSKSGLFGNIYSTRLSESYFGKASGLTITDNRRLGESSYSELLSLNSSYLDKIEFRGKSFLKHYSEGKVYDAVMFSEQAAENMGYFSHKTMKSVLGDYGTLEQGREQMIELLSTKGDAFLSTRFPRIQDGSDKVVMGYLDTSMKGNQIKALAHTGLSMNLDHDGDQFAIARITDSKGKSYLNSMVSGELTETDNAIEAFMTERAVNTNRYWDSKAREKVAKEHSIAISGNRVQDIAVNNYIDGDIISSNANTSARSEFLLQRHLENIKLFNETGSHDTVINKLREQYSDDSKAFETAKNEYIQAFQYQQYKDQTIAKSSKASIGEINITNYKVREVAQSLLDSTSETYNFDTRLMSNMMEISEQAAISAKSSIKGLDPDRAKQWNEPLNNLVRNKGDISENLTAMRNWANKYIAEDIDMNYYWETSKHFQELAANTINDGKELTKEAFDTLMETKSNQTKMQNVMIDNFIRTIDSVRGTPDIESALDYLSVGLSTSGVTKPLNNPVIINHYDSALTKITEAMQNTNEIADDLNIHEITAKVRKNIDYENVIDDVISEADDIRPGSISKIAMSETADLLKAFKGSNLAKGAVGLAAGVMALGYIGGRPRPAETHAMEEAQDYPEQQNGLIDPNILIGNSMQNGYIVNINARTDDGRDNAIEALKTALSSSVGGTVNMAVNINDNFGNITDRKIERIIKDAL